MTYTDQLALLDAIENFSVPIIPPTTHFWMIRDVYKRQVQDKPPGGTEL